MKVAVLKGGRSLERQVSLRSGARVQDALERGVGGTIFFAGDYVGEWTHMEGAAITGAEAAERARARLGVPA